MPVVIIAPPWLAFNFLGDGLRDATGPALRAILLTICSASKISHPYFIPYAAVPRPASCRSRAFCPTFWPFAAGVFAAIC